MDVNLEHPENVPLSEINFVVTQLLTSPTVVMFEHPKNTSENVILLTEEKTQLDVSKEVMVVQSLNAL